MGIESRRGAFHSFPLLTRLSIARSTSGKKKKRDQHSSQKVSNKKYAHVISTTASLQNHQHLLRALCDSVFGEAIVEIQAEVCPYRQIGRKRPGYHRVGRPNSILFVNVSFCSGCSAFDPIPDREGGAGCSQETWRAAGACQP